jgi:hypothetical protein
MPAKKKTLSQADIERELVALDRMAQALNAAVVALYYIVKPDKTALDNVDAEEYVKFVQETVHEIVRKADAIAKDVAEKAAKSAKEAVKE